MLKIKNVTAKNFMSVGNNTQAVSFDTDSLTLVLGHNLDCLLYTSPSPRDRTRSRMPSSA